ncbi:conserved hypothetical protein [Ktedonobacter racemifer DSM 44963]|uniref:Uncharacterized protein n=1 Tax=Ktedonobacter racemifer DSM 44963 TaxID=485913 RepID=D6TPR7_KTERA|nr:conserved hypothetical protein [Ktedonobacter racemifer DSM 44963]
MKRKLSIGFGALLLALAVFLLPASGAGTAYASGGGALIGPNPHCATLGSLIETEPIKSGTTTLAYLKIYYNSSNGYNCAETIATGSTYGTSKYMYAEILSCSNTR